MFKTYEEIIEKFPVGTVYRKNFKEIKNYYYNKKDISAYLKYYYKVKILDDNLCLCIEKNEYEVEGYIFDGEYWYPAKQTWDGWVPINEDEINIEEF